LERFITWLVLGSNAGSNGAQVTADLQAEISPNQPVQISRATSVLAEARYRFPWLHHIFADGGYAGEKLRSALRKMGTWNLEIIRRSDKAKGFEVLPRRWVVERTLAWLGRSRRLAKDWEKSLESAIAWLFIANIRLMTRRIAKG
jgi:putative transposase